MSTSLVSGVHRRLSMQLRRYAARTYYLARHLRNEMARARRDHLPVKPIGDLYPGAAREVIWAATRVPTPPVAHMVFHDDWAKHPRDYVQLPEVGVTELRSALFCPWRNIVLSGDRGAIAEESVGYPDMHNGHIWPPASSDITTDVVELTGTFSSFRCYIHHHIYYHALADGLPRLLPLLLSRAGAEPFELLVTEPISAIERYYLERLLPKHVGLRIVSRDALVRAERFLHVDYVTPADVPLLPRAYLDWFLPKVLPRRQRKRGHRIYIARKDAGTRRILNEAQLMRALEARGFVTYDLGGMPFEQQIELFYDAEAVVSAHGSGLTNLIFADSVAVVELFNSPLVRPHYWYLSLARGHRHAFVYGDRLRKNDDFVVSVDETCRQLDNVLNA